MPVNVSIKNVPDDLMEKLRLRAKRNRRSLQGELMTILEEVTENAPTRSLHEVEARLRELNFSTGDDSTKWIRELRNAH